jgi:hypothetical protein
MLLVGQITRQTISPTPFQGENDINISSSNSITKLANF